MNNQAVTIKGKLFKIGKYRIWVTKQGLDISNGIRGIFLYYPFNKHHSIKQYRLIQFLVSR